MPFPIHPHMLRHACGFKLANDGHDTQALQHYLGHKNIQHTVRYTEMAPDRFKDPYRGPHIKSSAPLVLDTRSRIYWVFKRTLWNICSSVLH
jgi:integrase